MGIVGRSGEKLTINFGNEYVLEDGDSLDINGKTVELVRVGQTSVVFDVHGIREIIPQNSFDVVNDVEIEVGSIVFTNDASVKNIVNVYIGEDIKQTVKDGEEYFNSDEWEWNLEKVDESKPEIWIELSESYVSEDDIGIAKVGGCYSLPENFVKICLTKITNNDYEQYSIELDNNYDDLDDVEGYPSEGNVIVIKNTDDGLRIGSEKTGEMILYINNSNSSILDVFIVNDDNDLELTTSLLEDGTGTDFAKIVNDDADLDLDIELDDFSTETKVNITMNDNIIVELNKDGNKFTGISKVFYDGKDISDKDTDVMDSYGIIFEEIEDNLEDNKFIFSVPSDKVKAVVEVGVSEIENIEEVVEGNVGIINPISSAVVKLDSEVTNPENYNTITIGGPAVNNLANSIFELTVADFTPNEGIVKIIQKGTGTHLFIGGYSYIDTLNAILSVVDGKINYEQAEIKVVSATQTRGTYTIETSTETESVTNGDEETSGE